MYAGAAAFAATTVPPAASASTASTAALRLPRVFNFIYPSFKLTRVNAFFWSTTCAPREALLYAKIENFPRAFLKKSKFQVGIICWLR
jgi:hypothetical protein